MAIFWCTSFFHGKGLYSQCIKWCGIWVSKHSPVFQKNWKPRKVWREFRNTAVKLPKGKGQRKSELLITHVRMAMGCETESKLSNTCTIWKYVTIGMAGSQALNNSQGNSIRSLTETGTYSNCINFTFKPHYTMLESIELLVLASRQISA